MTTTAAQLDHLSGKIFFTGLITSKLKLFPLRIVSAFLHLFSLFCYLIGYSLWFLATLFYPKLSKKNPQWYEYLNIKEQYQIASLIGLAASIIWLVYPLAAIPITYLFAISNTFWTMAEYQKLKNIPPEEIGIQGRQSHYFTYAKLSTLVSYLNVVEATLSLLFPAFSPYFILSSLILGNTISLISLYYWKKSGDSPPPPAPKRNCSYEKINAELPAVSEEAKRNHVKDPRSSEVLSVITCQPRISALSRLSLYSATATSVFDGVSQIPPSSMRYHLG